MWSFLRLSMMTRTTFISEPPPEAHPTPPSRAVPAAPATFKKLRLVSFLCTLPPSLTHLGGDYSYRPLSGPRGGPALVRECPLWEKDPVDDHDGSARERVAPWSGSGDRGWIGSGRRCGATSTSSSTSAPSAPRCSRSCSCSTATSTS